jgi:hypothetical protein
LIGSRESVEYEQGSVDQLIVVRGDLYQAIDEVLKNLGLFKAFQPFLEINASD